MNELPPGTLAEVTTHVMLRFLAFCRLAAAAVRPGPNVISLGGRRLDQLAATTVNHRLVAISGLFGPRVSLATSPRRR